MLGNRAIQWQRQNSAARPAQLFHLVAEVEVELAVRAEDEGVSAMIVIALRGVFKQQLALVRFAVSVRVREHKHPWRTRNNDLVAEHANAQGGVHGRVLVE